MQLVIGSPQGDKVVQIDAIEEGHVTTGGALQLYTLTYRNAERQIISNLCRPDATGRRAGFPLPDERGGFAFTCTSGAEGKCVLMGYRPWEIRDDVPMRDLHRACIRMVRADYGGDGVSTTRDGTLIDVFDRFGIQTPDRSVNMEFEAAWSSSRRGLRRPFADQTEHNPERDRGALSPSRKRHRDAGLFGGIGATRIRGR